MSGTERRLQAEMHALVHEYAGSNADYYEDQFARIGQSREAHVSTNATNERIVTQKVANIKTRPGRVRLR